MQELLCGPNICTVPICNKTEVFQIFVEMPECHTHGKDTCSDIMFRGYPLSNNGMAGGIHNELDEGFDISDFNICFISSINFLSIVIIMICEWLNANGAVLQ